jgi:hypothetical protein
LLVDLKLVIEVVVPSSKHKGAIKLLIKIALKGCTKICQAYKPFHGLCNMPPEAVKINLELPLAKRPQNTCSYWPKEGYGGLSNFKIRK